MGHSEDVGDLVLDASEEGFVPLLGQEACEVFGPQGGCGGLLAGWTREQIVPHRRRALAVRGPLRIEVDKCEVVEVVGESFLEQGECLDRVECAEAEASEALAQGLAEFGGHSLCCPGAPGEALRWQPAAAAMGCEGVEEGVGRGVVALSSRAQESSRGREKEEEVEFAVRGQLVEVPGAGHLCFKDPGEAIGILLLEEPIVEGACGVHDAAERALLGE